MHPRVGRIMIGELERANLGRKRVMKSRNACLSAVVIGVWTAGAANAHGPEVDFGQFEYVNSCAACHGADGKGEG